MSVRAGRGARDHDEDAFGDTVVAAGRAFALADGAGGHRGGAIASRLAVDAALAHLAAAPRCAAETLVDAVDAANAAVRRHVAGAPALAGMSTTLVLLALDDAHETAHWTHLGDSRLLHFRDGAAVALTADHSVRQRFVDAGLVLPGAPGGPRRNLLYAAVGADGGTRPVARSMPGVQDGDAFLLCSDGVWDTLAAPGLARLLDDAASVDAWVDAIDAAIRAAARVDQDNHAALGVWIGAAGAGRAAILAGPSPGRPLP